MTDDQFKQLMDKLDDIVRRLPAASVVPTPLLAGQCYFCKGYHGGSVICPNLRSRTIVAQAGG